MTFPDQPGRSASLLEWAPCRKCGGVDRFETGSARGRCRPCRRANGIAWKLAYPEKVKAINRIAHAKYRAKPGVKEQEKTSMGAYLARPENAAARQAYQAWYRTTPANAEAQAKHAAKPERKVAGAAKSARRRARKQEATPAWADTSSHAQAVTDLYAKASVEKLTVDHGVPLFPCRVCGAAGEHVLWNLQLLTFSQNAAKGNRCNSCWRAAA